MSKTSKKIPPKKAPIAANKSSRKIRPPTYSSFRLSKRIKHPGPPLPSSFKLFKTAIRRLVANKKLFFGIMLIYLLLTIMLVKGLGVSNNLPAIKSALEEALTDGDGKLITSVAIFGFLATSSGNVESETASIYQSMLLVIISLALIWALRQAHANSKVGIRDAFYNGMSPLIPFIIVMLVIGLQLIPLVIGTTIYGLVVGNGLAINLGEKVVWQLLLGMTGLLSLYMISSSIFALYVVTLPDMRPMQALRSARGLVRHRRWSAMRKVIFLPVILVLLAAIIMVPLILYVTPVAEWTFFVLTMLSLAVVHSYMYGFYRELLPHEKR